MQYHLATRFGRNSHRISGREALDNEALYRHVPSIFAREAHDSRSERYVYVPNLFDTADVYSDGASEEVLGDGPNDAGSSRFRLVSAVEDALRRLQTDHIDIFQLHAFDAFTPVEEVLSTLDTLVRAGKVCYVGVSNFSGWQIMKSLAVADRHGWSRYVANQVCYSLVGRDYEWDLMPLGQERGLGAMVWSPLGWGRLTGKIRRGTPLPEGSRLHETVSFGPPVEDEHLYRVVDALDAVAEETGKTVPQIALKTIAVSSIAGYRELDQVPL